MGSNLTETRRANLRAWVAENGTPAEEKSYFSQLISGGASFGERAARRLEKDYQMGHLFLDKGADDNKPAERAVAPSPARTAPEGAETVLTRVDAREQQLLTWFRESDERGKQTIESVAELVEKPTVPPAGS